MVVLAQLSAPENVTGGYGGSVEVSCQYDIRFRENTKYWCKGPLYILCEIILKTPRNRDNMKDSITDDKEAGVFTVTINSLSKKDEDRYWCVIAKEGKNIYAPVKLIVSPTVMPTPGISSLEHEEQRWWDTLRWILFILLLACLVSMHIALWRMKSAKKICQHQQVQEQNSNVYDIEATT
ncbi:CMRF35-like molecule 3 [Echeneis naucrates]|uniref:CMRF35-like molecule 3 n=1 Tax=Echeneis naucrates TaxID=173247 RepID=UPI001113626E|nr:CMRF35-like molecule 3 [Echeneis naucrates]